MNNAPVFAGMAPEDVTALERATRLRVANEARWTVQDYERVIAYLKAKATERRVPKVPPRCACPKRPRGPMRDVAHMRASMG
jgi:hypothetical protein